MTPPSLQLRLRLVGLKLGLPEMFETYLPGKLHTIGEQLGVSLIVSPVLHGPRAEKWRLRNIGSIKKVAHIKILLFRNKIKGNIKNW